LFNSILLIENNFEQLETDLQKLKASERVKAKEHQLNLVELINQTAKVKI